MATEAGFDARAKAGVRARPEVPIDAIDAKAFTIPTDGPESDGTLEWDATTIVVVHVRGGGVMGLGYTYSHAVAVELIVDLLRRCVIGRDAMDVEACYVAMMHAVRNLGRYGLVTTAISAVDTALWDLKARILDVPLVSLLGGTREGIPVYGSGGFTSYSTDQLRHQLAGWVASGIPAVKMKVGRDPGADPQRVQIARDAIGPDAELFVDANGALDAKVALACARRFDAQGVRWFEEPVSSDDLHGLRFVRERAPLGMDVAAGEYGYDLGYFQRMAEAGAVDVLQADATRCGGVTGFLQAAAVTDAWSLPMSAHTAPQVHAALCCRVPRVRHLEYFHDHVRIEQMLFDGALVPITSSRWRF